MQKAPAVPGSAYAPGATTEIAKFSRTFDLIVAVIVLML